MNPTIYNNIFSNGDGFLEVNVKGTGMAYFDVTYMLKGKQNVYVSNIINPLQMERIVIPKKSKDIKLRVFVKDRYNNWKQIYGNNFSTIPKSCFTVITTSQYSACMEVPCN